MIPCRGARVEYIELSRWAPFPSQLSSRCFGSRTRSNCGGVSVTEKLDTGCRFGLRVTELHVDSPLDFSQASERLKIMHRSSL